MKWLKFFRFSRTFRNQNVSVIDMYTRYHRKACSHSHPCFLSLSKTNKICASRNTASASPHWNRQVTWAAVLPIKIHISCVSLNCTALTRCLICTCLSSFRSSCSLHENRMKEMRSRITPREMQLPNATKYFLLRLNCSCHVTHDNSSKLTS